MYVKMNFGPNMGKEIDLAPEAAMELLKDGRASRAFTEPEAPRVFAVAPEQLQLHSASATVKGKRAKRS